MRSHRTAAFAALAVLAAAGCTGNTEEPSATPGLGARLLTAEQMDTVVPGHWRDGSDLATQVGGGMCGLNDVVEQAGADDRAASVLVSGEMLVRQTVLGFKGAPAAAAALAEVEQHLAGCERHPVSRKADLTADPLPGTWEQGTTGFRLMADIAGVPLVLDMVVWQDGPVLEMVRLTYPRGSVAHPAGMRARVLEALRA